MFRSAIPCGLSARLAGLAVLAALALGGCGSAAPGAGTGATPTAEGLVISDRAIVDQGGGLHTRSLMEGHPAYNSNPPTSGWHYGGGWLEPKVYDQPQPDELMVHSLEHGMVVIHYRQDLDQATVAKLATLTGKLQQLSPCALLVPRPVARLDVPIAVTAWARLLELRGYDEQVITEFFKQHVGHGPEEICPALTLAPTPSK